MVHMDPGMGMVQTEGQCILYSLLCAVLNLTLAFRSLSRYICQDKREKNTFIFLTNFFERFYLFIFRERGREVEKHQCVVVSSAPSTEGPGPQYRHVS